MKFPFLVALLVMGAPTTALAQEGQDGQADESTAVPFADDLLSGHLQVGLSAAYAVPFGRLSNAASRSERSGPGGTFALDLNYGVDRFVALGAYGQYSIFGGSGACDSCSAREWGAGLQVGYHPAQGLRIDPWLTYGVGYRALTVDSSEVDALVDESARYDQLEWMRLGLGADWYATSGWILSPFARFSAASTLTAANEERAGRVNLRFVFGLRVALDVPGR